MEHKDDTTKKSTLEVDENDILKMSEKIKQNEYEDTTFQKSIDEYLDSSLNPRQTIIVGRTPNSLVISGANSDLNVIINQSTLKKCFATVATKRMNAHGLSVDIVKNVPHYLRTPVMIFNGSKINTLVAITDVKDNENREIMIAVALQKQSGRYEVNEITSIYGRNDMAGYLDRNISQGNLIAYNKNKANKMLQSVGLQLPKEETLISFDNSIAYSLQNVKGSIKKLELSKPEKKSEQNKAFTFSRKQLNDNARKIKEQPSEQKHKEKDKHHNVDI